MIVAQQYGVNKRIFSSIEVLIAKRVAVALRRPPSRRSVSRRSPPRRCKQCPRHRRRRPARALTDRHDADGRRPSACPPGRRDRRAGILEAHGVGPPHHRHHFQCIGEDLRSAKTRRTSSVDGAAGLRGVGRLASQYKRWSLRSGRVMASCRVAAGIVPADSNRRMPRVRGVSCLVFGVKGLFPPKPPFISSLFREKKAGEKGGLPPHHGRSLAAHPSPRPSPRSLAGRNACPPPASVGILPRRVPRLPARRRSARASVAVRPGSHPGKPARTASFFQSFIIAYYNSIDRTCGFSLENRGFAGFSACTVMV